jgi:hypothetical protein
LVVVVDDLHWSDACSADALRFALRRLEAEPLLVVLITRPGPMVVLGDSWGRLLLDGQRVTKLRLEGLGADAIVELAASAGHGRISGRVAGRLRAHTHGNPLHARALLEELREAGLRAAGDVLPAPRSFSSLMLARLAALGPGAQRLVAAGAVLGPVFPLGLAAAVGGVSDPVAALEVAMGAGLLERPPGDDVAFPHPLERGAVYNDLSPTRFRDLHNAAAAATSGVVSLQHRVSAAGGFDPELSDEVERLAGDELSSGAAWAAHDHLLAAARLSQRPADRDRRILAAAEALVSAGELGRAKDIRATVESCADTAERSYVLGLIEQSSGRLEEAGFQFAAAAARAGDREPDGGLRARATAGLALGRMRLGRFEAAFADADAALEEDLITTSARLRWPRPEPADRYR